MQQCCKARLLAGFFLLLAGGCAILPQTREIAHHRPAGLPVKVELSETPFFPQEDYHCGPAALAMTLNAAGANMTPDVLVEQVYLPGRQGSLQVEMLAAARRNGYVGYELEPKLGHVLREIAAGSPVIVLQNFLLSWFPAWHYAVAIGYDLERAEIILRTGLKQRQTMPFSVFEYLWEDGGYWSMVAMPPGKLPATAREETYAVAVTALERSRHARQAHTAYAALLARWPKNLAGQIGLGNTAYALQDLKRAEAAFRQATLDHPDSAIAFNNLAQTLADLGNFAEAQQTARKAVSLGGPLQASAQTTLDEILMKSAKPRR